MAADASAASAGKKLAQVKHWRNLGQNDAALWGECQGSALYQVRAALPTLTSQCSCPSRKLPCKHVLGLLFLVATTPGAIPENDPPEWITSWLEKRAASSKRKTTVNETTQEGKPTASATAAKTAAKRMQLVSRGMERLDLWLNDLVRNGLGSIGTESARFWEQQAAQMVDAQAPGIASRLRRLATIPHATEDWPARLLEQLGQLALLSEAFQHLEQLDPAQQEEIRQLIGWNVKEDEVLSHGEHVHDEWLILGQLVEDTGRGQSQRTWLLGAQTRRQAMILQFAMPGKPFSQHFPVGSRQQAELVFWPGVAAQRALFATRTGQLLPIQNLLPGFLTIHDWLAEVTNILACQPLRERFLGTLCEVTPLYDTRASQWWLRDKTGATIPLSSTTPWQLLALSGGRPVDIAGEWNSELFTPLGVYCENSYHLLQGIPQ